MPSELVERVARAAMTAARVVRRPPLPIPPARSDHRTPARTLASRHGLLAPPVTPCHAPRQDCTRRRTCINRQACTYGREDRPL